MIKILFFSFCAFGGILSVSGKPGECPNSLKGFEGNCTAQCSSDDFCPGYEKCCPKGCGKTCRRPEKLTCPDLNCDESLDCKENGYKLDEFGCAMCECYVDPCPMIKCMVCPKFYNYSIIDGNVCRACDCVSSVNCPPLKCQCPNGYRPGTDINGCPTCRCDPIELLCSTDRYLASVLPVLDHVPNDGCPPMSRYDHSTTDGKTKICCEVPYAPNSNQAVCSDGSTNFNGSCGRGAPQQCTDQQECVVHEVDGWAVCCSKTENVKCRMDVPELSIASPDPVLNHIPEGGCPPMSRSMQATDGLTQVCCKVDRASASDRPVCNDGTINYSKEHRCGLIPPPSGCPDGWYCSIHETDGWAACCPQNGTVMCPTNIPAILDLVPVLDKVPSGGCPEGSVFSKSVRGDKDICCRVGDGDPSPSGRPTACLMLNVFLFLVCAISSKTFL